MQTSHIILIEVSDGTCCRWHSAADATAFASGLATLARLNTLSLHSLAPCGTARESIAPYANAMAPLVAQLQHLLALRSLDVQMHTCDPTELSAIARAVRAASKLTVLRFAVSTGQIIGLEYSRAANVMVDTLRTLTRCAACRW